MVSHTPDKFVLYNLPQLPGVYRFVNAQGAALYVGKAANLKKRVGSYFCKTRPSPRIRLMLAAMHRVEVTVTESAHAALLLENNLIKSLRPRYNILFRDDKSYPFLRFSRHPYPRLLFARGGKADGDSFGPFPDSGAVRDSINMLQRVFRLRTCADSVFANRSRPCLLHGIGRCSAPCVNLIPPADYAADAAGARALLVGDSRGVEADLQSQMNAAAAALEFERAAALRDRLRALSVLRAQHLVDDRQTPDADYLGAHCTDDAGCVNVVMVRGGRRLGEQRFFPAAPPNTTAEELLGAFIGQYYCGRQQPPKIIPSHRPDPPSDSLPISIAPRGEQKKRACQAAENARIALQVRQSQQSTAAARVRALGERLQLPPPGRIECFDISHSMGESPMAARAVFIDGAPRPAVYRRYAIAAPGGDDCAAIGEAVERCYRRAVTEQSPLPDLLLIDGGVAQLRAARAALAQTTATIPIMALAKGKTRKPGLETLITADGEVIALPPTDPALHLLQAVRDEAHRFAVNGHRQRRDKKRNTSVLEQIEGVGPKLRREIMGHFGGWRGLKAAAAKEFIKVKGVGPHLAQNIYEALHR